MNTTEIAVLALVLIAFSAVGGIIGAYIMKRLIDHFDPVMRRYKEALEESARLEHELKVLEYPEGKQPAVPHAPYHTK